MSYFLPHLPSGWHVDQAILAEENRVVIIRFGHDWDSECMRMDETLYGISEKVKNFAVIYLVDITKVPDFTKMYELYDPCTVMFFYRNKHIMIDLGTGNNNKINWAMDDKQEVSRTRLKPNHSIILSVIIVFQFDKTALMFPSSWFGLLTTLH
ncbi:U4/U6-U5 snRNP complex subunit dib1 [Puccinia graminis f. sp. tritici]|uniref:U4/U6-U5 snRNP complex subunit dib1 n=1 Tax=Puccinia graminis f. sp. tritici TaxID=56615 RepID=A0A5B0MVM7_PUCGR|nr:U4/U6-U5 snRNP complex subunit dib1 [Puccinia graminis f. sp. tritici]